MSNPIKRRKVDSVSLSDGNLPIQKFNTVLVEAIDSGKLDKDGLFKRIGNWGVTNFLKRKLPEVGKELFDVVVRGESPIKAVQDLVFKRNKDAFTESERMMATEMVEKDFETFQEQVYQIIELERLQNQDRESARNLAKATAQASDKFVRRFPYYLAMTLMLGCFMVIGLLFLFEVPPENQTMVDIAFGVLFTLGFGSMIQFFFGENETTKLQR